MKDLLIAIYGGGDEAVAAVQRLGEDWRLQLEAAATAEDRLRLTDAERSAVADAADRYAEITPESAETASTLRGLLERLA